ncbi:MAG: Copper homeostasis protein CutC [bacterium ADurb.Bin429]|nr:MAG: Copper homeostasis protein CutC [bacterium ADurb.Bin429]
MSAILIEICCGSLDDALAAQAGGADRIELNSSLLQGGLTPSLGTLIEAKRRLTIPIMTMIRPRGGGFCYTDAEFAVMERDAELANAHGTDGLVFGVLHADGTINLPRTRRLIAYAGERPVVFHRAFDVTPDPLVAMEQLIDLGVTRILTSGQEETVYNGATLIRQLIERAAGRIEILPGGGIDRFNLPDVLARTGTAQIHLALLKAYSDPSALGKPHVFFGGALRPSEEVYEIIDATAVAAIKSDTNV